MPESVAVSVARYLGLLTDAVLALSAAAPTSYKRYAIRKRSGGWRVIHQPAAETKAIQYALMETLLPELPVHAAAAAYVRGRQSPLRENATKHADYRYSVRVDFKDFFPSIVPDDLLTRIRDIRDLSQGDEKFLGNALFVRAKKDAWGLAIGAPSSPMISNAVMYSVDRELSGWASGRGGAYTRYADDLVYSSNEKGCCAQFVVRLETLLKESKSPHLTINRKKTVYSSPATRRLVTGLIVTANGEVSIGRCRKRYLRRLLDKLKNGRLSKERRVYLRGYLSFVLDVEPELVDRLATKFGASLLNEALLRYPERETN
jgi:hypothetical protein